MSALTARSTRSAAPPSTPPTIADTGALWFEDVEPKLGAVPPDGSEGGAELVDTAVLDGASPVPDDEDDDEDGTDASTGPYCR